MKHYLPDMELFNNAVIAGTAAIAGNDESFTEERLFGFPLPALSAIPAFTAF
jgi:hypothetical protein